jgi:hypothetical protein
MMLKKTTVAAVLFGLSAAAYAAEPPEKGAYIGAGAGSSTYDDDGAFIGLSFDDTDTSLMLFGGYKFLKHLAVEGRYQTYGSFTVSDVNTVDLDVAALSVHAVGIVPFGTSGWELFGHLGLGIVSQDVGSFSDDVTAVGGGLGVRWYVAPNFALSAQTDVFVWEDDSLGSTLDVSAGATQLTVQYVF